VGEMRSSALRCVNFSLLIFLAIGGEALVRSAGNILALFEKMCLSRSIGSSIHGIAMLLRPHCADSLSHLYSFPKGSPISRSCADLA